MNKISSKMFHYQKDTKCFVAEASNLPDEFNYVSSFIMIGEKTGREIEFIMSSRDIKDDEIIGWHFKPTSKSIMRDKNIASITVLIIND